MLPTFSAPCRVPADFNVQLSRVIFSLFIPYFPFDDLPLFQRGRLPLPVIDQQHPLSPVRFRPARPSRESGALSRPRFCSCGCWDGFVTRREEEGIEPDDEAVQGVNFLGKFHAEGLLGEGQVLCCGVVQWQLQKWLRRGGKDGGREVSNEDVVVDVCEHAGHGEAVDGLPEGDVVGDVVWVGERGDPEGGVGGDHETSRGKVMGSGPEDGIEHCFV